MLLCVRSHVWCLWALLPLAGIGCSGGSASVENATAAPPEQVQPANGDQTQSSDVAMAPASKSDDSGKPRRQNERWTDANGVEYLGNVPLDVFFDQPYSVASNLAPIGGGVATGTTPPASDSAAGASMGGGGVPPASTEPPASAAATTTAASSDGGAWADIIPMKVIDLEITNIRNFLEESLPSVGAYNRSMLMIPPKAAATAILSSIVQQHSEDISWKEDAAYIRNFAKKMNESVLQPGKKDQDRLLGLFENMKDTLNRSRPAGVDEPPAEDSFAEVAEMRYVMMRMEDAEKKMKTEVGSESAFGSKKEMVSHEAAILGTMSRVVTLQGYGYEDDAEFKGYAQKIIDATKEITSAAETGDYNTFTLAMSKVSTACQECHSVFKNN